MLTRRHIRIKIMQALYAQSNGNSKDLDEAVKQIKKSLQDVGSLYLLHLGLLRSIWLYSSEQYDIQKNKLRTNAGVSPGFKALTENKFLQIFGEHPRLGEQLKKKKLTLWDIEFDFIQKATQLAFDTPYFKKYLAEENKTFKKDQKLVIEMFRETLAPHEALFAFYEDFNITFIDDMPLVNTFFVKQMRRAKSDSTSDLFSPQMELNDEDMDFAIQLFQKTWVQDEELQTELEAHTPNWDGERIAQLDALLIKMALSELINFPTIPEKVTINEYLELAKEYSTPKSNLFVNGVLDGLVKRYKKANKIQKTGKGLL